MPKPPAWAPKPALDKVPLAVRKDLRDKFESKKDELEKEISDVLGVTFHININPNEIWAYAPEGSSMSAGNTFKGYVEGFISAVKKYVQDYGDEGKSHFNEAVTQNELTLSVSPKGDKGDTISADIKDGVFRILFHPNYLGYNMSYLNDYLLKAVEAVPREGFSLVAKTSIEDDFNSEIDDLKSEIASILNMPDVILDPNFEENYKMLLKKSDQTWQDKFGKVVYQYFEGLKGQLESQGFKGDDMLQEGLAEIVTSKTFKVRVLEKCKGTNETVVEDGIVYLQTTPDNWWYNTSDMGRGLVDKL